MKIRYLINNSTTHFLEYTIDLAMKTASYQYVKGSTILNSRLMNIASVLDAEIERNPFVQLAKKGRIWDFHIFKIDEYGKEFRKSLGFYSTEDLVATKVELINDGTDGITLKDYTTHELEVYNSSLLISSYEFTNVERMTGSSGFGLTRPETTLDGKLKLGYDANITLQFIGEGELSLRSTPTAFFVRLGTLASNTASLQDQFILEIGSNQLAFDKTKGIYFNGTMVIAPSYVKDNMVFKVEATATTTNLYVEDQVVLLSGFDTSVPITEVRLRSMCDNGEYTLVDEMKIYALENYRLDSIPPEQVVMIEAVAGDGEVFLKWEDNTEEDLAGYNVYVNGYRNNIATILTPDFQATGLINGEVSTIVVTAVDKSGNESLSSRPIEIKTISDPIKEVSNLTSYVNDLGVTLEWGVPSYPDYNGIKLYRIDLDTNQRTELVTLEKEAITFQDTPSPEAGAYMYVITTFDVYNNETTGVELLRHIPATPIQVPENETLEFAVPVSADTMMMTVSVNPTWTFSRTSATSDVFDVRYVNSKTGEDIVLPQAQLVNTDGTGAGTLFFKNDNFALVGGTDYNFTVTQLDSLGATIDTDTIVVQVVAPTYSFDSTKITGLGVEPTYGVFLNGLHLVDPSVTFYAVSIDGGMNTFYAVSQLTTHESGQVDIPLSGIDWTVDHVFSVSASTDGTAVFGQAEVTFIAPTV